MKVLVPNPSFRLMAERSLDWRQPAPIRRLKPRARNRPRSIDALGRTD